MVMYVDVNLCILCIFMYVDVFYVCLCILSMFMYVNIFYVFLCMLIYVYVC